MSVLRNVTAESVTSAPHNWNKLMISWWVGLVLVKDMLTTWIQWMPQLFYPQHFVCFVTLYFPCEGDAYFSSSICGFTAFSIDWISAYWSTELCFRSTWVEWFQFDWVIETTNPSSVQWCQRRIIMFSIAHGVPRNRYFFLFPALFLPFWGLQCT